jgi:hypothetical protein
MAAHDTTLPVGGGPDQRSRIAVREGQIVLFSVYVSTLLGRMPVLETFSH